MPKITTINFIEYYSELIPKSLLENFLLDSECDSPGKLNIKLSPGRKLSQKGPYLIPPIRWLESFEYNAEFEIICDIQ